MKKTTWGPLTQLIFLPRLFPVNCYLVEDDQGVTLIDAGMPFVGKGIYEAIQATGKPLTRILLTHAHMDHIGAVPFLKEKYPSAKIGLSGRDCLLLKGDRSLLPTEVQTPLKGGIPKQMPFSVDFEIQEGDRFGSLVAISSPGHTPGHFSFLETISGTLIAGDAFTSRGGLAVSGHLKWSFPFPALATWHAPTALASARKLQELNSTRIVVGHGPATTITADNIQRTINDAERYMKGRHYS
jgi:glyoxylase-like metal-dependent hydrolase (beta-lactamase superfamily II)